MSTPARQSKFECIVLTTLMVMLWQAGCDNRPAAPSQNSNETLPDRARIEIVPIQNMIPIKAGTFVRNKHSVTISRDFWLGKYEVTQAEYSAVMGRNPSQFTGDTNRPVEKVSYWEATQYCEALSLRERVVGHLPRGFQYRLPTEAEWEYACRANTTNFFSFGAGIEAGQYAWTEENSEATTHPVGLKRPNPWGLHDMHGNVWEWCFDWFAEYPAADVVDPVGPRTGKFKLFRGGGWDKEFKFARSANRFMMAPASGIYFVGFRVALGPSLQSGSP